MPCLARMPPTRTPVQKKTRSAMMVTTAVSSVAREAFMSVPSVVAAPGGNAREPDLGDLIGFAPPLLLLRRLIHVLAGLRIASTVHVCFVALLMLLKPRFHALLTLEREGGPLRVEAPAPRRLVRVGHGADLLELVAAIGALLIARHALRRLAHLHAEHHEFFGRSEQRLHLALKLAGRRAGWNGDLRRAGGRSERGRGKQGSRDSSHQETGLTHWENSGWVTFERRNRASPSPGFPSESTTFNCHGKAPIPVELIPCEKWARCIMKNWLGGSIGVVVLAACVAVTGDNARGKTKAGAT